MKFKRHGTRCCGWEMDNLLCSCIEEFSVQTLDLLKVAPKWRSRINSADVKMTNLSGFTVVGLAYASLDLIYCMLIWLRTNVKCCCLMLVFTCSRPAAEHLFYLCLGCKNRRDSGWKNPEKLIQGVRSFCSSLLEQPAPEQSLASNHLRGNVKWLLLYDVRSAAGVPHPVPHISPRGLDSK